jgi:signal transduction histidine kinase
VSTRTDLELPVGGIWTVGANAVALVGLALLIWGVSTEIGNLHSPTQRNAAAVLLTAAALSWLAWLYLRSKSALGTAVALVTMAVAGGALSAFAPNALVFPAVAVLSATTQWPLRSAAALGVAGWLATAIAVLATGASYGIVLGGVAAILGGAIIGITRRQAVELTEQAARTEVQSVRAEVERDRAELLSERNHLARELHDVLAHTLAALSLQLEAFATVVDAEPDASPAIREQLQRTRRLVHEGLDEARGAVQVLRDDPTPLPDRLATLCDQHGAVFTLSGSPQRLAPAVSMALFRVTQESLTNVMKHATGASTVVDLSYSPNSVSVTIDNLDDGAPATALSESGGGQGLRGIGERLAMVGGQVEAGPRNGGWRVSAVVPLPTTTTTPVDDEIGASGA